MADNNDKLTVQQDKFVQSLVKGKSQREAYYVAYPHSKKWTDNTVDVKACNLFAQGKIKIRYEQIRDKIVQKAEEECIVTVAEVLRELKSIGFADINDFARIKENIYTDDKGEQKQFQSVELTPTDNITSEKRRAIAGIKQGANGIEIKMNDKLKALELLGKHLGMFEEQDSETDKTVVIQLVGDTKDYAL